MIDALGRRRRLRARSSCSEPRETPEKLSLAGTPRRSVEKIKTDIEPAGVNHMILALSDSHLVEFFSGQTVENVPDIRGQLKLVAERVVPAFG